MLMRKIPVGISDFKKIRENGYYYVDKTGLISSLMENRSAEVTLITRPRRFGKTLGMSMLASFLDIRQDNYGLFKGLEVAKNQSVCEIWLNQCPTLYLSFKDIDGTSFENAFDLLKFTLAQLCDSHDYLLQSPAISNPQKQLFQRLQDRSASLTDVQGAFLILTKMMQAYYRKPVVLLLDEYDVPLAKASANGYYTAMLEVIKPMLSTVLKDNPALDFAILTGCLKLAKESIFTGTNNFVSDTISSTHLNEFFGFTEQDVDRILKDFEVAGHKDDIKSWYDGYHFGNFDVYCPWDVMNYIRDLTINSNAKPTGYWKNTSDNSIIRSFIDFSGESITQKLETLLSGAFILQHINESLTYDMLNSSEENLWSILYLTGYLTAVRDSEILTDIPDGMTTLMIPNAEIREIFETTIIQWFSDSAKSWDRKGLFSAVWERNPQILTREMTALLRRTISYHDYREDFYHAFLAGIFTGAGYAVDSNKEHGEGRSDIIIYDPVNSRVAIFEAKRSRNMASMENDCARALKQIDSRLYAKEFADDYDTILCYGIAFYKKRCLVRIKES